MPYVSPSYIGYALTMKPSPSTTFVNRFCGACRDITRWTDERCRECGKGRNETPVT
jgi:hypothetical protein